MSFKEFTDQLSLMPSLFGVKNLGIPSAKPGMSGPYVVNEIMPQFSDKSSPL